MVLRDTSASKNANSTKYPRHGAFEFDFLKPINESRPSFNLVSFGKGREIQISILTILVSFVKIWEDVMIANK